MRKFFLIYLLLYAINAMSQENLIIKSKVSLGPGNFGVITLEKSGDVTFVGIVNINNLNENGKGSKVTTLPGSVVTIKSSYNPNGNHELYNYGVLDIKSNMDVQGGRNKIYNSGHIKGVVFQLLDKTSTIENCGKMDFSGNSSINGNECSIKICECSYFKTGGLDVNSSNVFSGKGNLIVTGNLNLNKQLTNDPLIFTYKTKPSKNLGDAIWSKHEYSCPLPIKFESIKWSRTSEGLNINMKVSEFDNSMLMIIEGSKDGKTFKEYKSIPVDKSVKSYSVIIK